MDIDSELITKTASCSECYESCSCPEITFTVPVRAVFKKETGFVHQSVLQDIKQRKGEAEMAQVDWLMEIAKDMKEKEAAVRIVTSADVDSLVIHLFRLAFHWPRNQLFAYFFFIQTFCHVMFGIKVFGASSSWTSVNFNKGWSSTRLYSWTSTFSFIYQ